MIRHLLFSFLWLMVMGLNAQDDIYDNPEPVKPRVVYSNQALSNDRPNGDGSYENIDDSYNPDFDYRYRRSLRRMYDPYYIMPGSAYLNMYTYPQFSNFYNPFWGSGFSITIGNAWGNPYAWNSWGGGWNSWNSWNNPWGWNSWNSWYSWHNPWGWNNWNNPWCGWNSWGGGWNSWNNWGGGWNNPYWGTRGQNWNSRNRNVVNPPERRVSRAVRVMDPDRDYGNTTYRPSSPSGNSSRNTGTNTPVFRSSPNSGSSPSGTFNPAPSRMGNMTPRSTGGSSPSGGSGGRTGGGRSSGGSRF